MYLIHIYIYIHVYIYIYIDKTHINIDIDRYTFCSICQNETSPKFDKICGTWPPSNVSTGSLCSLVSSIQWAHQPNQPWHRALDSSWPFTRRHHRKQPEDDLKQIHMSKDGYEGFKHIYIYPIILQRWTKHLTLNQCSNVQVKLSDFMKMQTKKQEKKVEIAALQRQIPVWCTKKDTRLSSFASSGHQQQWTEWVQTPSTWVETVGKCGKMWKKQR